MAFKNIKSKQDLELEEQRQQYIEEKTKLIKYMDDTDHKAMLDYEPKPTESVTEILNKRRDSRNRIREIIEWLESNVE